MIINIVLTFTVLSHVIQNSYQSFAFKAAMVADTQILSVIAKNIPIDIAIVTMKYYDHIVKYMIL